MLFNKLIVLGFIFSLITGCSKTEGKEWGIASKLNTRDSYIVFLENFPSGKFSEEARNHLKGYFRELHKDAINSIQSKKEESNLIYNKILRLDPGNALALNNKAFIIVSGFNAGRETKQKIFSDRDRKIIQEGVKLLKQAKENAGSAKISPGTLMLAFVFMAGEKLELVKIRAGKLPEKNDEPILIEKLININLKKLVKLLERQK